jgi:exonuclease III
VRVWANAWLQAHPGGPRIVVGDLNDGRTRRRRKSSTGRERIDHILASTDLARRKVGIAIDTTQVTSIGDQPSRRRRAVWPDHAPVVASIS